MLLKFICGLSQAIQEYIELSNYYYNNGETTLEMNEHIFHGLSYKQHRVPSTTIRGEYKYENKRLSRCFSLFLALFLSSTAYVTILFKVPAVAKFRIRFLHCFALAVLAQRHANDLE